MADSKGRWLEIEDEEVTAVILEAAVDGRWQCRQIEDGIKVVAFPTFGEINAMPEMPSGSSGNLYWHLRALNAQAPPETTSVLAPSPATQIPVLGRLWQTIRAEAHNLVLFYVNRSLRYTTTQQKEVTNVLNELTRLSQAQQMEIEQLKTELQTLQEDIQRKLNNKH